jgi:hypothetical protein
VIGPRHVHGWLLSAPGRPGALCLESPSRPVTGCSMLEVSVGAFAPRKPANAAHQGSTTVLSDLSDLTK